MYGGNPSLRAALAGRGLGYVLAVAKTEMITVKAGSKRAIDLAVTLLATAWNRFSAGQGATGERLHDRATLEMADGDLPGHHYLMIRRSLGDGEVG